MTALVRGGGGGSSFWNGTSVRCDESPAPWPQLLLANIARLRAQLGTLAQQSAFPVEVNAVDVPEFDAAAAQLALVAPNADIR